MNENRGAKGGKNDRRRTLILTKEEQQNLEKKKKLSKEELKKLEQEVRKQQIITFLKAVPIVLVGGIFYAFRSKKKGKQSASYGSIPSRKDDALENNQSAKEEIISDVKSHHNEKIIELEKENKGDINAKDVLKEQDKNITNKEIPLIEEIVLVSEAELLEQEIAKAKSKRIVEEYENKIKEIRASLRNIYFEASILEDVKNIENDPSEENLEKLNQLIAKLEELRYQVEKDLKVEIDEDYLSVLVEDDLQKLEDNIEVQDIDNSKIYIEISDKIEKLKAVEQKLGNQLKEKKEEKNVKDEKMESLKDKYLDVEQFKSDLKYFEASQLDQMQKIRYQVSTKVDVIENTKIKLDIMEKQTNFIMDLLDKYMKVPGIKASKMVAIAVFVFIKVFGLADDKKDKLEVEKNVETTDVREEIDNNVGEIDDVLALLENTSSELDTMIADFEREYGEYYNTVEYQEILDSLHKIKQHLEERQYEIDYMKKEHEKNLEMNDIKVYTK